MKILIVNTTDIEGGAARAAYRLHRALCDSDVDSRMLVQYKKSDETAIYGGAGSQGRWVHGARIMLDHLPVRMYKDRTMTLFSPAWLPGSSVVDRINEIDPDIVHLHWICGGMLRIEDLARIKAPIVWSLHDMWAFTGGCHYDEECGLYTQWCGRCKVLGSARECDMSKKIYERKRRTFVRITDMTIVGLSRWITQCAQHSPLMNGRRCVTLPNPLDTEFFAPCDKKNARAALGLPQDKKLVLFGAMSATSDPRKGFAELSIALQKLNDPDVELVVFGSRQKGCEKLLGFTAHYMGQIDDDADLIHMYSAADVMIVPSLQENLSNAIMESLSCATPVVAFAIGGNDDMIEHDVNGYLAKPFDTDDLARGIAWVLDHPQYDALCAHARQKVVESFDAKIVARQYRALYESIVNKK